MEPPNQTIFLKTMAIICRQPDSHSMSTTLVLILSQRDDSLPQRPQKTLVIRGSAKPNNSDSHYFSNSPIAKSSESRDCVRGLLPLEEPRITIRLIHRRIFILLVLGLTRILNLPNVETPPISLGQDIYVAISSPTRRPPWAAMSEADWQWQLERYTRATSRHWETSGNPNRRVSHKESPHRMHFTLPCQLVVRQYQQLRLHPVLTLNIPKRVESQRPDTPEIGENFGPIPRGGVRI